MASSSYRPTGHLKPREVIPESQCSAIANMSSQGYCYRSIFALLRSVPPAEVRDDEVLRFGRIARARGCGTNNYRMMLSQEALDKAVKFAKKLGADACPVKPSRALLMAFVAQSPRTNANKTNSSKQKKGKRR